MAVCVWQDNLLRAVAAAVSWAALHSATLAQSADVGTTTFGRSVFAVLDDHDASLRRYGWTSLEVLGRVAEANELHTKTFTRFLESDGRALARRIEILLAKATTTSGKDGDKDYRADAAEIAALQQAALGVPEIAKTLVTAPGVNVALATSDLEQVREASKRVRPVSRPVPVSGDEFERVIGVLRVPSGGSSTSRVDAASRLVGRQLSTTQLEQLEQLIRDRSMGEDTRRRLAIALVRNQRASPALEFADELLSDPNRTSDHGTFALQILTQLVLSDPLAGRRAVSERSLSLTRFLGDLEHLRDASAVLSQVSRDDLAKANSLVFLKRIESGVGLAGSACAYAAVVSRSPQIPLGLALYGRMLRDREDPAETAACVVLLDANVDRGSVGVASASNHLRDLVIGSRAKTINDQRERLAFLDTLWTQSDTLGVGTVGVVRRGLVDEANRLVDAIPLVSLSGVDTIATWAKRAEASGSLVSFSRPYWTRWAITRVPAVASALFVWVVSLIALVVMSRSETVRAFLLFHPVGRQLAVFGQVKALVFALPPLRRLFFRPYRSAMLGILAQQDARAFDDRAYFSGSGAARLQRSSIAAQLRDLDRRTVTGDAQPAESVVTALRAWKGRVVLVGPSGRGKTMFLRHHILGLGDIREPAIFATAASLGRDPNKAITARFGGAIPDDGFLDSLTMSGRLDLYIDGLNEVDVESRAAITDYVTARGGANVFITTQPLERYPGDASLFLLLPLTRDQVVDFLITREPTLSSDAQMRGADYLAQAKAFVAEKLAEADAQASAEDDEGTARSRALVDRLSNPMDLQTIAELLALGQRPDVWTLQKQRHAIVERHYRERTNNQMFPFDAFSRSVYEARRDGKTEIEEVRFSRVAEILLEEKQIQRYVAADSTFRADGYVFRHDKIRDFYTYQAFVVDPTLRVIHAADDKFAGVYDLLSLELSTPDAIELREFLAERALDRGDHRLSDRYLEGLRARRMLQDKDPDWLSEFDRSDVVAENDAISHYENTRTQVLEELGNAIARLDAGRAGTRVLCADRSDSLLSACLALFEEAGYTNKGVGTGQRTLLGHSKQPIFGLLTIAHHSKLPVRLARATRAVLDALPNNSEPTLVVINDEADLPPAERSRNAMTIALREIKVPKVSIVSACDLLMHVRKGGNGIDPLIDLELLQ